MRPSGRRGAAPVSVARVTTGRAVRGRRVAEVLAVGWATWAALRATGTERGYPLVPALAFTPYAAALGVLPVAVGAGTGARAATAVSGAATVVLAAAVLRRAGRRGTAWEPGTRHLRVATVSLRYGRADPAAVVSLVADHRVDVLALQEVTPEAELALRAAGIGDELPHSHVIAARDGSPPAAGGALWSRWPMLARLATPGRFEQPTARIGVPGAPDVEVTAVHTAPPSTSPRSVRDWTADLAALPGPDHALLRVLAGDFNATFDHAAFRRVVGTGFVDAAWAVGRALWTTWTPLRSPQPRLTLDHVLLDPRVGVAGVTLHRVPRSDHRAVVAELVLPHRAS